MLKFLKILVPVAAVILSGTAFIAPAQADGEDYICAVYFSGIGCHHCEISSPLVLETLTEDYPQLVVIDYEIYLNAQNALVFDEYLDTYEMAYEIPSVVLG